MNVVADSRYVTGDGAVSPAAAVTDIYAVFHPLLLSYLVDPCCIRSMHDRLETSSDKKKLPPKTTSSAAVVNKHYIMSCRLTSVADVLSGISEAKNFWRCCNKIRLLVFFILQALVGLDLWWTTRLTLAACTTWNKTEIKLKQFAGGSL